MCGRFALDAPKEELLNQFNLKAVLDLEPRYNIAPSQQAPIIRIASGLSNRMTLCRWGLIPSWSKDEKIGYKLINARSETVHEKPSFKASFKQRRCLVPATGFFEWKAAGDRKLPYYITMKGNRLFAMAGLWDMWKSPEGIIIESFTILTTEANGIVNKIHDRMPVIIQPDQYGLWLAPSEPSAASQFFRPFSPFKMTAWPVSGMVNNPRNDAEGCIRKINYH